MPRKYTPTLVSAAQIQAFFELVYPTAEDGWLVLSYPDPTVPKPDGRPPLRSLWFDLAREPWHKIAHEAELKSPKHDVYFGVALQAPDCAPAEFRRSRSADAYVVPGMWADIDLATGRHAASQLPQTDDEALQFLNDLPKRPSVLVHSGGGFYGYWLFREPYVITNDQERETIAHLSKQFAYTLVKAGTYKGWTLDAVGDLARVLRPPGTINHKYGTVVELIRDGLERYNLSDFDWLEPLPEPARAEHQGQSIDGQPNVIMLAQHYGTTLTRTAKTEHVGAHPRHGSSTGSNFTVNEEKGLWHCWRHGTGGDALALIAVCEGLVPCEDARRGALRGDRFVRAVQIANERFQASITLDAQRRRNGTVPGPQPSDPFACPELPPSAQVNDLEAALGSPFLDDYTEFSAKWVPRAYWGFHEAVALFVLSTVAARRVRIRFGPHDVYTSLYIALCSRTTIFNKTTTAKLGLKLLEQAGLEFFRADDNATPQAFLRALTAYVNPKYDDLTTDQQQRIQMQLAFTGQRGWFYEEWGQHLEAMMAKHGFMAEFRGIMRLLDDHPPSYTYSTISRGGDELLKPYVSLLGNVTLADVRPFVQAGKPLWRDGYIARMAFVTPESTDAKEDEFPNEEMQLPNTLVNILQKWHQHLQLPTVALTPRADTKGKPASGYTVTVGELPEYQYTLSQEVWDAFYAYDKALIALTRQRQNEDLDGSYGRFAVKALRIAGLLASLHNADGDRVIHEPQWYRGQQIAEHWREDLHRLVKQVQAQDTPSRLAAREERIVHIIRDKGTQTIATLHNMTKWAYTDIRTLCDALVQAGVLTMEVTNRAAKYSITNEET